MLFAFSGLTLASGEVKKVLGRAYRSQADASFEEENFSLSAIREMAASADLFGGTKFVVLRGLLEKKDTREILEKEYKNLAESPNTFLIFENIFSVPTKRELQKHATVIEAKEKNKSSFVYNPFSITNALRMRDKKNAWRNLQEARLAGVEAEQLSGIIWWLLKHAILVASGAPLATLTPAGVTAGRAMVRNFKKEELATLAEKFEVAIPEARRRGIEPYHALEKIILEM